MYISLLQELESETTRTYRKSRGARHTRSMIDEQLRLDTNDWTNHRVWWNTCLRRRERNTCTELEKHGCFQHLIWCARTNRITNSPVDHECEYRSMFNCFGIDHSLTRCRKLWFTLKCMSSCSRIIDCRGKADIRLPCFSTWYYDVSLGKVQVSSLIFCILYACERVLMIIEILCSIFRECHSDTIQRKSKW